MAGLMEIAAADMIYMNHINGSNRDMTYINDHRNKKQ